MVRRKNQHPQEITPELSREFRSSRDFVEPNIVVGWDAFNGILILYEEDTGKYVALPSKIMKQIIHQFDV